MARICIVIPCYNEAERLPLSSYLHFAGSRTDRCDILFVNDGSTDSTQEALSGIRGKFPETCSILSLGKNVGKAEAIRQGVLKLSASGTYSHIAYLDADLATPFSEIMAMIKIAEQDPRLLLVLGSRWKRLGSTIIRKRRRHFLGRVFATFASIILKLPVYDTQCGAKLLRSEIAAVVFAEPFLTRWLFDIELIARIRNANRTTIEQVIFEHPVKEWRDVGRSKLRLKHMLAVPFQLLRIHRLYN
ncbi:MAG: glycosyltransferase [Bacteroidetes bacterium]|jgi:glycosyltransferase involved in cell wall biosynthesis|nr:glycosyltransferase [Bacteroidota bacterium]